MNNLRIDSIKRKEKIKIFVNGDEVEAYIGETLLAALIASGYKKLRSSPVNGEPRGALCGMGVCYECIVTIDDKIDVRSCMTEVKANMKVTIND